MSSTRAATCWRPRPRAPRSAKDVSALPQVAALLRRTARPGLRHRHRRPFGADRVEAVPKLGWYVFFEQPISQALAPIRDLLLRIALLIALGLIVAMLAGTRAGPPHAGPDHALRAGARRLGAGDFGQRIEVKTSDELEELADQFNSMAGQLQRDLFAASKQKVRSAPAISRNRSTNSRCWRKSAARWSPRSISRPCCRRSPRARSKSPAPMRC